MVIGWAFAAHGAARRLRLPRLAAQIARGMVGVRDYPTYVAHRRQFHPGEPVMTQADFFRACQGACYAIERGGVRGIG